MTDLISAALRERADGNIHIERLLAAVHAGARRRRRWRVAVTASAVVAAVAVAAAGSVAVSGTGAAPVRPAASPGSPGGIPRPPVLEGVPVAAFTPTALGSDPTLFHLDLTGLAAWSGLNWSSRAGYEELHVSSTEVGGEVYIEASQSRDRLSPLAGEVSRVTVNGLPAELVRTVPTADGPRPRGGYVLRWEPVPGIWAQVVVVAFDREAALLVAERVRLDRTLRCAVPFRFSGLGDRARVIKCENSFSGGRTYGAIWLADGDAQAEYYVTVEPPVTNPTPPTETIGGRAVAVVPVSAGPGGFPHLAYAFDGGLASFYPFYTGLDDPFLRSLVPAFVPVSDPDPRNWPQSPLR